MLRDVIIPLARAYLSVVLMVAGTAKLLKPHGFRQTIMALGLPQRVSAPAAAALATMEVLVAFLLWGGVTARMFSLAAACLFGSFAVLGIRTRSQSIRCSCFGDLTDDTLGIATAVRNIPLMVLALGLTPFGSPLAGVRTVDLALILLTAAGLFLIEPLWRYARG